MKPETEKNKPITILFTLLTSLPAFCRTVKLSPTVKAKLKSNTILTPLTKMNISPSMKSIETSSRACNI
ncbi:MAG: hypothetical protein LBH04_00530 [Tannerellaceae bacterium]|nr:hypothetical protein [Tannerellaceae bacterium]